MAVKLHYSYEDVFEHVSVDGDGNCLFRAMSQIIWGSQQYHAEIRKEIVEYVVEHWEELGVQVAHTLLENFDTPEKYVTNMGRNRVYGSEFELGMFCKIYRRNAVIYRPIDEGVRSNYPAHNTIFLTASFIEDESIDNALTAYFLFTQRGPHYDVLLKLNNFCKELEQVQVAGNINSTNVKKFEKMENVKEIIQKAVESEQEDLQVKIKLDSTDDKDKCVPSISTNTKPKIVEKMKNVKKLSNGPTKNLARNMDHSQVKVNVNFKNDHKPVLLNSIHMESTKVESFKHLPNFNNGYKKVVVQEKKKRLQKKVKSPMEDKNTHISNSTDLGRKNELLQVNENKILRAQQEIGKFNFAEKFVGFMKSNGYTNLNFKKGAKDRNTINKNCCIELFGDSSNKNLLTLRRMYKTNYKTITSKLKQPYDSDNTSTLPSASFYEYKTEKFTSLMVNVICRKFGMKTTKADLLNKEKEVFNTILADICKLSEMSVRNKKNIKICQTYYKTFLTKLAVMNSEYVCNFAYSQTDCLNQDENMVDPRISFSRGMKIIGNPPITETTSAPTEIDDATAVTLQVAEEAESACNSCEFDVIEEGPRDNKYIQEMPHCVYCKIDGRRSIINWDELQEVLIYSTDIKSWNVLLSKENSLEQLRKELISIHRLRHCGSCIWKQNWQSFFLENQTKSDHVKIFTLHDCIYQDCTNWLQLKVVMHNTTVKLYVGEHKYACNAYYNLRGHYDYYKNQGFTFDKMDEVLYKQRDWSVVFDPKLTTLKCKQPSTAVYTSLTNFQNMSLTESKEQHNTLLTSKASNKYLESDTSSLDAPVNQIYDILPNNEDTILKEFSVKEGTLIGTKNDVKFEDKNGKENLRYWIRHEIISQLQITCRLSFKLCRPTTKKGIYIMYAKCSLNEDNMCKDFKLKVNNSGNNLTVEIFSRGPLKPIHLDRPKAYQIRGQERKKYKEILKVTDAKTKQNADIKTLNENARIDLNMQDVRTLGVLRQCRLEAFKEDDLHRDDLIDLLIMAKADSGLPESDQYIQQITAVPLQVYLYSKPQRDLVLKNDILVAYFDATGSIVRNVTLSKEKVIYYYAMVVNINSEVVPIAELFSEAHDIPYLQGFFKTYKYYYIKKYKCRWPVIKRVVTDWSWAIITGLIMAWNDMDLLNYLNICYKLCNNLSVENDYKHIVTIHICNAHFMKMVSDNLTKAHVKNKEFRHFVLGTMAAMIMSDKFADISNLHESFAIALLSEKKYTLTEKALEVIRQNVVHSTDFDNLKLDTSPNSDRHVNSDYMDGRTKIDSPFYKKFETTRTIVSDKLSEIREKESKTKDLNKFYSPVLFDYVQDYLMPLVPLWSGLMIGLHPITEKMNGRFSNSNVENFFKVVKHRLLKSRTNLKIGRVIKVLRENINDSLTNVRIDIAEYNKGGKRKKRKIETIIPSQLNEREELCDEDNDTQQENIDKLSFTNHKAATDITKGYDKHFDVNSETHMLCRDDNNQAKDEMLNLEAEDSNSEDVDDPRQEESWCRTAKRKSSISYFQYKGFKKLKLSISNKNNETNINDLATDTCKNSSIYTPDESKPNNKESSKFRISICEDYPHKEAMQNALFKNPAYYNAVKNTQSIVVSIYKNITPTKTLMLFDSDFSTYGDCRELSQAAVDACIASIIKSLNKKKVVKYVNLETTWSLFREKPVTIVADVWVYFNNLKNFDLLLMPYLVPLGDGVNHYCLVIGDLKNKTCIFYNPLPKSRDNSSIGHAKFRRFLNQLDKTQYQSDLSNANNWSFIEGQGAVQRDGVNCGVYIIHFVENWLKNLHTKEDFLIPEYRNYLQILSLEQSSNMSNVCLYCGKGETRCKLWTMCDTCRRWVHHKSCLMKYVNLSEDDVQSKNILFECIVCLEYYTMYGKKPWNF